MYGPDDSDPELIPSTYDPSAGSTTAANPMSHAVTEGLPPLEDATTADAAGHDAPSAMVTNDGAYNDIAVIEAEAAEERHIDAGGVAASAESHKAIVGATAKALASGSLPRFVRSNIPVHPPTAAGPSQAATRLLKGLGAIPTEIASYTHAQLPTLSVSVNVSDDVNNNDIEVDLLPSA